MNYYMESTEHIRAQCKHYKALKGCKLYSNLTFAIIDGSGQTLATWAVEDDLIQ